MFPPHFVGDPRHRIESEPLPDWFIRDMGERIYDITPVQRWRLPIWPGFRLELKILPVNGADHV